MKNDRVFFNRYYTRFVEHCLRVAVRKHGDLPDEWHKFGKFWLDGLDDSDRKFIKYVFDEAFTFASEGCACFGANPEDVESNKQRLYDLEERFAVDGGLYCIQ